MYSTHSHPNILMLFEKQKSGIWILFKKNSMQEKERKWSRENIQEYVDLYVLHTKLLIYFFYWVFFI